MHVIVCQNSVFLFSTKLYCLTFHRVCSFGIYIENVVVNVFINMVTKYNVKEQIQVKTKYDDLFKIQNEFCIQQNFIKINLKNREMKFTLF